MDMRQVKILQCQSSSESGSLIKKRLSEYKSVLRTSLGLEALGTVTVTVADVCKHNTGQLGLRQLYQKFSSPVTGLVDRGHMEGCDTWPRYQYGEAS